MELEGVKEGRIVDIYAEGLANTSGNVTKKLGQIKLRLLSN